MSLDAHDCPDCEERVMPIDGQCPLCERELGGDESEGAPLTVNGRVVARVTNLTLSVNPNPVNLNSTGNWDWSTSPKGGSK